MHRLQQHILSQLILNPKLRYAQLKPADVEGNLFMYHLRQLINQGLVLKGDDGYYCLSGEGQSYADRLSLKTLTPRIQPRIVTLIAVQDERGRWLLYRRRRQPLIDMVGFPYGKIHLGESVSQAAERELKEKTGLTANLAHRGDGYATIYKEDSPVSQIFFHLFSGTDPSGRLKPATKTGRPFWGFIEDLDPTELMPTVPDMLRLIDQPDHFFTELVYR